MPKFLSAEEIYKLIARELPENVYAYSPRPEDFYTTSDDYACAVILKDAYVAASGVYLNYFPQNADEYINKWEEFVFGKIGSAASGLAFRRERVLSQIRSRKGITKQDIIDLVQLVIGTDKDVEIIENNGTDGSWTLDVSELGLSTILNSFNSSSALLTGPDLWEKTAAELGLTEDELTEYKRLAYTYIVRINDYEATAVELAEIERLLTLYEPARSGHTIENNAQPDEDPVFWELDESELDEETYL